MEWIPIKKKKENPLSTLAPDYLFERLQETKRYTLKEHETVFLKMQNLIFSIAAGSIWFFSFLF